MTSPIRLYVAPAGTPMPVPGWPIGTPDDPWTDLGDVDDLKLQGPCEVIQEIDVDTRQLEASLALLREAVKRSS